MFMAQDFSTDKAYYQILEVEYDATEESIRASYLRLALKWHPDKHNNATAATLMFQEINEAYKVLSDPLKRYEYDMRDKRYEYDMRDMRGMRGMRGTYIHKEYNITEYLQIFKSMILTCNGLGISSFGKQ